MKDPEGNVIPPKAMLYHVLGVPFGLAGVVVQEFAPRLEDMLFGVKNYFSGKYGDACDAVQDAEG